MTFETRRLATTLWIGKILLGLLFSGEATAADAEALLVEPEIAISELVPPVDGTIRLHSPYPD